MVSADIFLIVCYVQMRESEDRRRKSEESEKTSDFELRTLDFKQNNRITK
jgi:hypothetical protein